MERSDSGPRRSRRSGGARSSGQVHDPEAAAEVVDEEAAERGQRLGGLAEACEVEQLRADVDVQASQLERRVLLILSISAGASSSATPNFASGLPVSIAAYVLPGTAGFTRSSTRWVLVASRSRRSTSSSPSITMTPTPASNAAWMSVSLLALPCSRMCSASNPAASAIASSPADATSHPSPSSARIRVTGAHGSALEAKCTSVPGVAGLFPRG